MSKEKQSSFRKIMAIRGMGAAITAFIGLIVIYVASIRRYFPDRIS